MARLCSCSISYSSGVSCGVADQDLVVAAEPLPLVADLALPLMPVWRLGC